MRVVSILPPLPGMKLSMNVGPPVRLILDKLTFTNSRLILRESFLPVTEDGSSSTVPAGGRTHPDNRYVIINYRNISVSWKTLDLLSPPSLPNGPGPGGRPVTADFCFPAP